MQIQALVLKMRQPEEEIECWDDDNDLQVDEINFRGTTLAVNSSNTASQSAQHRDSISSHLSLRSELESSIGGDEERQLLLPEGDEESTIDAITAAIRAGIPIPTNVPSSALVGGSIKRLGGKRSKKVIGDDWSEDLDLGGLDIGGLKIKKLEEGEFPTDIPQSSLELEQRGSERTQSGPTFASRMESRRLELQNSTLDKFRDEDGDNGDDLFKDPLDVPTIKVAKHQSPPKAAKGSMVAPPSRREALDDFERDFVFPTDSEPLKLPPRKDLPKTPGQISRDEFDDWAEGSLGTRYGGTRRDGPSNRSSSISALSPSITSSLTMGSEDEDLEGLVLPEGPLDLQNVLKRRQQTGPPIATDISREPEEEKPAATKDDFFAGIEIGDGDVFDSGKLTLNRNIKHKATRPASPARRTAVTLTFKNKTQPTATRIPRPHERTPSTLEPVSEGDGSIPPRRSQSRPHRHSPSRHSPHSSTSSIPTGIPKPKTPPTLPMKTPNTPHRPKTLGTRPSMKALRPEPTTTSAQLLKMKRSMPAMRSGKDSPSKPVSYHRPPSRTDCNSSSSKPTLYHRPSSRADSQNSQAKVTCYRRPSSRTDGQINIPLRPKTPIDRYGAESTYAQTRKNTVPFLSAGPSHHAQSHHISVKTSRHFRRHGSDASSTSDAALHARQQNSRPASRSASRTLLRSPSPRRKGVAITNTIDMLTKDAASKRTLTRPKKPRNFGDGSELEIFDDLPTSERVESKFVKQPVGRGAPRALKSRLGHMERSETPTASGSRQPPVHTQPSPMKYGFTPRFARDTHASRIAREQRTGVTTMSSAPGTNWKSQFTARGTGSPPVRRKKQMQEKPHLIKPLGDAHNNPKFVKGMSYNPQTFSWEGNENVVTPFEESRPGTSSPRGGDLGKAETPRPALIVNVNATPAVQIVGSMVFDPQRMCWLKLKEGEGRDEEDPFADVPDLDDGPKSDPNAGSSPYGSVVGGTGDWCVGEEFDVGPEFIKRQRDEEARWKRKVGAWMVRGQDTDESWRWALRELAGCEAMR